MNIADEFPCVYFYTSGSTGEPRGILHSRMSFVNAINHDIETWGEERIESLASVSDVMFAAFAIDVSMLLNERVLHIIDRSTFLDGHAFKGYISEHGIDFASLNPSYLRSLGSDVALRCNTVVGERPGTFPGLEDRRVVTEIRVMMIRLPYLRTLDSLDPDHILSRTAGQLETSKTRLS